MRWEKSAQVHAQNRHRDCLPLRLLYRRLSREKTAGSHKTDAQQGPAQKDIAFILFDSLFAVVINAIRKKNAAINTWQCLVWRHTAFLSGDLDYKKR
jgi:hypothetical protein